jgi:hypothetical protein
LPLADLNAARARYADMRELIIHNSGGWDDVNSRQKIHELCRAAAAALGDAECRDTLARIAGYADDLFSQHAHQKWSHKAMKGTDFLRLQILRELEAFQGRLFDIEAAQTGTDSQTRTLGSKRG